MKKYKKGQDLTKEEYEAITEEEWKVIGDEQELGFCWGFMKLLSTADFDYEISEDYSIRWLHRNHISVEPSKKGYRDFLLVVIDDTTNEEDREWARAELAKLDNEVQIHKIRDRISVLEDRAKHNVWDNDPAQIIEMGLSDDNYKEYWSYRAILDKDWGVITGRIHPDISPTCVECGGQIEHARFVFTFPPKNGLCECEDVMDWEWE